MSVPRKIPENTGIWYKRFARPMNRQALLFTSSVQDDKYLMAFDIAASIAHTRMLKKQQIISHKEEKILVNGLRKLYRRFKQGKFLLKQKYEDVHTNVEQELKRLIGRVAQKLHTARSRNDLVAADLRMYVRAAVLDLLDQVITVQQRFLAQARAHFRSVIPGYTHLQRAQPILWSYYLLSHACRLQRDFERLHDALKRVNVSPLGACACSGTSHNVDSAYLASLLRFDRVARHALDAVSDRDFLNEVAHGCVQMTLHCASYAEDVTIYSTEEFDLVHFDDSIATGSSIMPHKKNPDVCELIRAKTGETVGNLTSLLVVQKGLPSAYNRDLQETKHIMLRQIAVTRDVLEMMALLVPAVRVTKTGWADQPHYCGAVELVDFLVRQGQEFRTAYHTIARCVRISSTIDDFITVCSQKLHLEREHLARLLTPQASVYAKKSKGSTGYTSTRRILAETLRAISHNKKIIRQLRKKYSLNHLFN